MKKYILMVLFLVSACNKSSDSSGGTGIVGDTVGAGGSLADLNKATNGYSRCYGNNFRNWKFENNKATLLEKVFSGSGCQEGSLVFSTRSTIEVTTLGTSAENTSATKIDLKKIKLEMAEHTQSGISSNNSIAACGKTDWIIDEFVDITNTSCLTTPLDTTYQIFKISGDSLIFGVLNSNRDGTAPGMRPVEFDDSFPFIKQ